MTDLLALGWRRLRFVVGRALRDEHASEYAGTGGASTSQCGTYDSAAGRANVVAIPASTGRSGGEHIVRYLHGDHLPAGTKDTVGQEPLPNDDFAALDFHDLASNLEYCVDRRRFEVIDVE